MSFKLWNFGPIIEKDNFIPFSYHLSCKTHDHVNQKNENSISSDNFVISLDVIFVFECFYISFFALFYGIAYYLNLLIFSANYCFSTIFFNFLKLSHETLRFQALWCINNLGIVKKNLRYV